MIRDDTNVDEDPADGLRRRLYGTYGADPVAEQTPDLAPSAPSADFTNAEPTPPQQPIYQTFNDAPSNESYQPPPDTAQPAALGYTNPEPPRSYAYEGNDITSGSPPPVGATGGGGNYADVPGFDTSKINDPTHVNDKYTPALRVFSQGLSAGVPIQRGNLSSQVSWAQGHGFPNARQVGDDSIDYGDGHGPIDIIRSDGAVMFLDKAVWGSNPAPAAAAQTPAPAGTRSTASAYSPLSSNAGSALSGLNTPQGLWGPEFTAQIRQLLMQRLQANQGPVDENATGISQAVSAARDETTRASDRERNQLAERLYAQGGLNTDELTRQIQQSGEQNAGALSSLRAKLVTQELQSRRDDMRSLLSMALQTGDSESARAIQLQLADLEAQLRRESMGVSLAEFGQQQNAAAGNPAYF